MEGGDFIKIDFERKFDIFRKYYGMLELFIMLYMLNNKVYYNGLFMMEKN